MLGQEATNLNHSQCSNPSRPLFNVLPILSVPSYATSETLRVDGECHFYRGPSAARLIVTTTSRKSTRRSSRLTSPSDKVPRVQTRSLCSLTPASNLPVPSISHRQQQFANVSPTLSFLSKIALGVSQRHGFWKKGPMKHLPLAPARCDARFLCKTAVYKNF